MKIMNRLVKSALVVAMSLAAIPLTATAQNFPDKPIKILCPFPPGGGTDFVSRIVAAKLGELTGWQVVVENKPGAGGNLAIEAASKAPADGYTLVMGQTDNMMLGPWLYNNLSYDSVKSFAPVIQVSVTPAGIGTSPKSDLKTPQDLVRKGKTAEGLRWGTAGLGTLGHLVGEDFKKRADINVLQVPYKGAGPAITDVMGGQVDVYIGTLASLAPHAKSGKLLAVAVTSGKRSPEFPDVPTLDETVAKGMDFNIWTGLFAPAGTPAANIAILNKEINRVLAMPDVIAKMNGAGVATVGGSVADFTAFVKKDYAVWEKLIKESGVKLN
ncbi:MAG: Bug family tripartite tricarboxylate transporter substrate binding protein [Betaproteobacteria bacterium]